MTLDEYGREPGTDYQSQSWLVDGVLYTNREDAVAAMAVLDAEIAARNAAND
jgi:hypothetical protein